MISCHGISHQKPYKKMLRSLSQAKKSQCHLQKLGLRYVTIKSIYMITFLLIVQIARLIPEIAKDL